MVAQAEVVAHPFAFSGEESRVAVIIVRAGKVDRLVGNIIVAHQAGFYALAIPFLQEFFHAFAEGDFVVDAFARFLGIGKIGAGDEDVAKQGADHAAFAIELLFAQAFDDVVGLLFGIDGHAAVAAFFGAAPPALPAFGGNHLWVHLLAMGFGFLQADHIGVGKVFGGQLVFALDCADAVHVPGYTTHDASLSWAAACRCWHAWQPELLFALSCCLRGSMTAICASTATYTLPRMAIAIIDYEAGNLTSVLRALQHLGVAAEVTADPERVRSAERVIFPGVGAAEQCMGNLVSSGLGEALRDAVAGGNPVLGICVGMQLMLSHSEEDSGVDCLNIFPGTVERFRPSDTSLKVPHMGWNPVQHNNDPLFAGIDQDSCFYFVHSYFCNPSDDAVRMCSSTHGQTFCAGVRRDNVAAVQFHPEKSGPVGLQLLKNFAEGV